MKAHFNRFTIEMTKKQALFASHQGKCDEEVDYLLTLPKIRKQLRNIPDEDIIAELAEYGAWNNEELKDSYQNDMRIVWIAACNIKENL